MFRFVQVTCSCFLFASLSLSQELQFPDATTAENAVILLERHGCLGMCPSYSVTVHGNGVVDYTGRGDVDTIGVRIGVVSKDSVRQLIAEIAATTFFWLSSEYSSVQNATALDAPACLISVQWGCLENRIISNCQPIQLSAELAARIDEIANTEQWTGVKKRRARLDSLRTARPDLFR